MKTSAQRRTRLAKADAQGPDGGVDNCQASLSSHGRMGEEEERARKVGQEESGSARHTPKSRPKPTRWLFYLSVVLGKLLVVINEVHSGWIGCLVINSWRYHII